MRKHLAQIIILAFLIAGCSSGPTPKSTNSEGEATQPPIRSSRSGNKRAVAKLAGLVITVIDGDTIKVFDEDNNEERVRLHAIDAPENRKPFSKESTRNLAVLVGGKKVIYEDRYRDQSKRIVGKVLVDDVDVGLEQIRAGLAWHFKRYEKEQSEEDRRLYAEAENDARSQRRGLWQDINPVPPWVDRDGKSDSSPTASPTKKEGSNQEPKVPGAENGSDRSQGNKASSPSNKSPTTDGSGQVIGNKRSMIYHLPGCPDYHKIAPSNRVQFTTREEAEIAGYRPARNCQYYKGRLVCCLGPILR